MKLLSPKFVLLLICLFILQSCGSSEKPNASLEHRYEVDLWHSKRIDGLNKDTGWLNLVGLHWLEEGDNSFGSSKKNKIVFPKNSPEQIGVLTLKDSIIIFTSISESKVMLGGKVITKVEMKSDVGGNPTILEVGSLKWFIIKRGDKYGIRLRDLEAELLADFNGIERFAVDSLWKINAKVNKYDSPQKIMIPTILGTAEESFSPGKIVFKIDNKEYSLEPTSAGKGLFIIFADLTSGEETYGAGRYLYVGVPDSKNNVVLDFNKSYNPPCAFTKFATCLLPPDQNKLRIRITAGEKNYGLGH